MVILNKSIWTVLILSSMLQSMDRPNNQLIRNSNSPVIANGLDKTLFQRISTIEVLGNTAFFPNQTIINEAVELGFSPCPIGVPFTTVKLTNDVVKFKHNPMTTRKILHIPCIPIIEGNGRVDLTPIWSFTYDSNAQEKARQQMFTFYNGNPQAKMNLNNLNDPLVSILYEDNFIRSQVDSYEDDVAVKKVSFGFDEN